MYKRKAIPDKTEQFPQEPILTSKEINLGLPRFAKPFIFKIQTLNMIKDGNLKFGPYMVLRLVNDEWPNNLIRKCVNMNVDEEGSLEAREALILADMFNIEKEDDWKKMIGQTIAIMMKVKQTEEKKEARTKDNFQIVGCDILSPEEYLEATEEDVPLEKSKEKAVSNVFCGKCKETIPTGQNVNVIDGINHCDACANQAWKEMKIKEEYAKKREEEKKAPTDIFKCTCGNMVKTANKEKHERTNHKMFIL
jgi:hypothetical protein